MTRFSRLHRVSLKYSSNDWKGSRTWAVAHIVEKLVAGLMRAAVGRVTSLVKGWFETLLKV